MTPSIARTAVPSRPAVKVLSTAVRRAVRLDHPAVGTEHLLIALVEEGPLGGAKLRGAAVGRGTAHWADDDAGPSAAPDAAAAALLREINHGIDEDADPAAALPGTGALHECLRAAIVEAGAGVLTTTHLALALLGAPTGRATELFTVRGLDVEEASAAVRAAAEPEQTPAVWLLRKVGALQGESGGGYVRWMTRLVVRGQGLGGPVLLAVRNEAGRLAARAARAQTSAVDLVAAVLTLDDQIVASGKRLRPEHESPGAAALRSAGVDPTALLAADVEPGEGAVEKASAGAKLVAARRGHAVVGTAHLLVALLDDPADPIGPALRGLGVDPGALRAALEESFPAA